MSRPILKIDLADFARWLWNHSGPFDMGAACSCAIHEYCAERFHVDVEIDPDYTFGVETEGVAHEISMLSGEWTGRALRKELLQRIDTL